MPQLTVGTLIEILKTVPKDTLVYHVEFGALTCSHDVDYDEDKVVISGR